MKIDTNYKPIGSGTMTVKSLSNGEEHIVDTKNAIHYETNPVIDESFLQDSRVKPKYNYKEQ